MGEPDAKKQKTEDGKKLFITVIGGGNSSPIFAVQAKLAGHEVAVLTRRPENWNKDKVTFVNEDPGYLGGETNFEAAVDIVTSDPAECIPQSDMIFIAGVPIHHNPAVLQKIAPHLNREKEVMIGSICGYGGFNWVAAKELGKGNYVLFATQLIPWTCGTKEQGKAGVSPVGAVFGGKRMLRVATEDGNDAHGIKDILKDILKIDDMRDTDFIASTLWPNNSSLHPPILYGLFKDWDGEAGFDKESVPVRIYADLTKASAEALAKMDDDLVALVDGLKKHYPDNKHLNLNFRLRDCILENYKDQVEDDKDLESTVKSNVAFGKHNIPYEPAGEEGKIRPILAHKFFETDLTFGLCTFKDIALMAGVETPFIDTLIEWNQRLNKKEYLKDGKICGKDASECVLPSAMGLTLSTLDKGLRE